MSLPVSLAHQFLIAMPRLADPNFSQTVTFLCEHTPEGALGIIINRPTDIALGDVLKHMNIEPQAEGVAMLPVYLGGPVQRERGFVIHAPLGKWDSMLRISDIVGITTSRDILVAMARGEGPRKSLVALGYAGWGPGQLEREIADNAWLNGPADAHILFDVPSDQRWRAAAARAGVDLHRLSNDVGHA